jgi:hypothetical protein
MCINTHTVSLNNSLIIAHEITLNMLSKKITKASNIPILLGCGALSPGTFYLIRWSHRTGIKAHFEHWRPDQNSGHQSPSTAHHTAVEQRPQFCCKSLKSHHQVYYYNILNCGEHFLWRIHYFFWCWDGPHKNILYSCIISRYVANYSQKCLHECQHTMFH